jgi:ribosome-binding protein aMBF1 (putative translation factor)
MNFHQDWTPVVFKKKEPPVKRPPPESQKKVERNLEELKHKTIPKYVSDAISKKRLELKMTQTQLAQKINERPSVVNDIENGKGVYNSTHVNKILRALGLTLGTISRNDGNGKAS